MTNMSTSKPVAPFSASNWQLPLESAWTDTNDYQNIDSPIMNMVHTWLSVVVMVTVVRLSCGQAIFYTNTNGNDVPRIGKRPQPSQIVRSMNADDLQEFARWLTLLNTDTSQPEMPAAPSLMDRTSLLELLLSDVSSPYLRTSSKKILNEISSGSSDYTYPAYHGIKRALRKTLQTRSSNVPIRRTEKSSWQR